MNFLSVAVHVPTDFHIARSHIDELSLATASKKSGKFTQGTNKMSGVMTRLLPQARENESNQIRIGFSFKCY